MGLRCIVVFSWTVFLCLSIVCLEILIAGPLIDVLGDATIMTKGQLKTDDLEKPIEWPDLVICRIPKVKNVTKYQEFLGRGNFTSQEEFDEYINDIFYTEVNEIIQGISIGTDYLSSITNFGKLKAEPPFVKIFLVEYFYFGNCAAISLESIRAQMIKEGDVKATDKDSNFMLAVFLKGSDDGSHFYNAKFVPPNETIIIAKTDSVTLNIQPNSYDIRSLTFESNIAIKDCKKVQEESVSSCIHSWFDKNIGKDYNKAIDKYFKMANMVFSGGDKAIFSRTGCKKSCKSTKYISKPFLAMDQQFNHDPTTEIIRNMDNHTSILFVNHIKDDFIQSNEETYKYTVMSFISDAGGILGIFLGISFWSIFNDVIAPLIRRGQEHVYGSFKSHA